MYSDTFKLNENISSGCAFSQEWFHYRALYMERQTQSLLWWSQPKMVGALLLQSMPGSTSALWQDWSRPLCLNNLSTSSWSLRMSCVEHKLALCGPALRTVGELISEVFYSPLWSQIPIQHVKTHKPDFSVYPHLSVTWTLFKCAERRLLAFFSMVRHLYKYVWNHCTHLINNQH